jgi:sugar/nucleoside kinase (ribokinase family)
LVLLDKGSGFIQKKELVELAKKCRIYLHTVKPIDDWCRDIVFIVINEQTFIASEKFIDDNKSWLAPKLIVTLGERGASYLGEKTGDYYAAIYPAKKSPDKEINSQADAGIAFFAGFVAGYARSQKPETAISLANNYACKILTSSSF